MPRRPGLCGSPNCDEPALSGRLICAIHAVPIDKIKAEMESMDYRTALHGRGVKPKPKKREKRGPTCCYVGCYESRDPGTPFCHEHQGNESD